MEYIVGVVADWANGWGLSSTVCAVDAGGDNGDDDGETTVNYYKTTVQFFCCK